MLCSPCGRWPREYLWFSIYLPVGPEARWAHTYYEDPDQKGLYWYLVCRPACEITEAREALAQAETLVARAREALERAIMELEEARDETEEAREARG